VPLRQCEELAAELEERWSRIEYALTVARSGYVDCDYVAISGRLDHRGVEGAERAETWEELAAFYEWRLTQRADEMADSWSLRYLLVTWTDSMCYSLRRSAAYARGDDPGPVIPQSQRIPEVYAELHARLEREYGVDRRRVGVSGGADGDQEPRPQLVAVGVTQ
jgi:hypothetical protein